MEIFAITDSFTLPTTTTTTTQVLGFSNFILNRHNSNSSSSTLLSISASISPVDSMAPPAVRPNIYKRGTPRTFTRRKRRTRRRSQTGESDDGHGEAGFYSDGGDGPFGGSGSGNGGGGGGGGNGDKGWNYYGGADWDESSSSSFSDPAFDFVYKVIGWIVLYNCMHFAIKKIFRIGGNGFGDPSREKVPIRLVTVY
ncbi:hypothetical protein AQUCO_00300660v1 [Aquilegia coerulea]|uniref:Uncharacterized protein n=1 Tax=Aquilegia coerulea TaxID=218851 RepID=A0A2G5EZS9_AQUCA|nr:hypothetical protein AQUCO_00300660v1 [Aquilegia coerulea]